MLGIGKIAICNMALSHVGGGRIDSLTEKTKPAQECNLWYDFSRQSVLELFDWGFARKRADLALHGEDAPQPLWVYRYRLPSDYVAARSLENPIGPDEDAIPYQLLTASDGNEITLVTSLDEAKLWYTFDQKSEALFPALFVTALAHTLAAHIAYPITNKRTLKNEQLTLASQALRTAPAYDANQEVSKPPRDAESIRGRA